MMRNFFSASLLTSAFFFCQVSQAQTTEQELDNKYTPNQNSIFNNLLKKGNSSSSSSDDIEIKNSVQFCPTLMFRQKVGLFYERELGGPLSIVVGVAKAFGNDIFQSLS